MTRTRLVGSAKFLEAITEAGIDDWEIKKRKVGEGLLRIKASRGVEEFSFVWRGPTLAVGMYSVEGEGSQDWKNLSAAVRQMQEPPFTLHPSGRYVRIPFSMEDSDEKVLEAVAGRNLKWINSLSDMEMEALVPAISRHTRLDPAEDPARRTLTFASIDSGFRSVRICDLVGVQ